MYRHAEKCMQRNAEFFLGLMSFLVLTVTTRLIERTILDGISKHEKKLFISLFMY